MSAARISFVGRLGNDATLRAVGDNDVVSFSVAVGDRWKDKSGQKQERTTWFRCDKWTGARGIAQYLTKGTQVHVYGKMQCTVKDVDGSKKEYWTVNVEELELLGSKSDGDGSRYGSSGHGASAKHSAPQDDDGFGDGSDLPF